jgi:hypothetical protein
MPTRRQPALAGSKPLSLLLRRVEGWQRHVKRNSDQSVLQCISHIQCQEVTEKTAVMRTLRLLVGGQQVTVSAIATGGNTGTFGGVLAGSATLAACRAPSMRPRRLGLVCDWPRRAC